MGIGLRLVKHMDFQYQYDSTDELSRSISTNEDKDYYQSTEQAFYFIEDIENIEVGDMVSSYCNGIKVGSREWIGTYTDIPAMGNDNSDLTKDYCRSNQVPVFVVEKSNGETYQLTGDIPSWDSNEHMLSILHEAVVLPESYGLASVYPNPFNPSTSINISLPKSVKVKLDIYDLSGKHVQSLLDGELEGGYHQIKWNADSYSSGVYFVKMIIGEYAGTQKLVLVK